MNWKIAWIQKDLCKIETNERKKNEYKPKKTKNCKKKIEWGEDVSLKWPHSG